jgi:nucleotide-binding universal stress UspA family protein
MFKRLLVPTDGSELSMTAIKAAVALAAEMRAGIVALNVQPVYQPPVVAEVPVADVYSQDDYEAGALAAANRILAEAAAVATPAGVACKSVARLDASPHEAIIRVAKDEDCDLIFMASHGRRGMAHLLLGSETQKVLTHCRIPVLVYR